MATKKTKLNKFVCVKDCFHKDRRWTAHSKRLMYSTEEKVTHFKNLSSLDDEEKYIHEEDERLGKIKNFLVSMDVNDDEQWTKDGLPRVDIVEENTDLDTDRGEISKAFAGFTRDSGIKPLSGQAPDAFLG